jgi:ribA/ribD-fused uncharacterized protein
METDFFKNLPEVFTNEILEGLSKILEDEPLGWQEIFQKMTFEQDQQISKYYTERQLRASDERQKKLTQDEKDSEYLSNLRWGATRWNDENHNLDYEYINMSNYLSGQGSHWYGQNPSSNIKKRLEMVQKGEQFYYVTSYDSPFSTFYISPFFYKRDYNSVVQLMMADKAKLFLDRALEIEIMKSEDPFEIYNLGKTVKNFDIVTWRSMYFGNKLIAANRFKFTQNEKLQELLFSTKGKTIAMSCPNDQTWGIGCSLNENRSDKRS